MRTEHRFEDVADLPDLVAILPPVIEVEELECEWLDDSDYSLTDVLDRADAYAR